MMFRKSFLLAFAVTLGFFGATAALAWTGPAATPPGANATAPLNAGGTGQVKVGGLQLNTGGAATGLIVGGAALLNGSVNVNGGNTNGNGNWAALNVGSTSGTSINAQGSIYSYTSICASNSLGNCTGAGGVVLAGSGSNAYGSTYITGSGTSYFNSGTVVIGSATPYAGGSTLTVESRNPAQWTQIVNYKNGAPSGQYGIYVYGTTYALYANGPVYGTAFYYLSDERAKKNIEAIASSTALQKILALQPVTYNWKDADKPTTTQIGFIAQQVKKVVPELVLTDASTTQESVDYARVTPLLVGAAQAQQAQIDAQYAAISAQQKEIDALVAEVRALKAGK